jgi:hypothetical protein
MTINSEDNAKSLTSDIKRLTEKSLQHWITRMLWENDNINNVVAVGNKLALQEYLVGNSYARLVKLHLRFTVYTNSTEHSQDVATRMSDTFNSAASMFGYGKPTSHWTFLCMSLRRLGLIPAHIGTIAEFANLVLFKPTYSTINKVKTWGVGIDMRQFGHASDLTVVTVEVASSKLKNALDAVGPSSPNAMPLVPLNFILDDTLTVSKSIRFLLANAVVTGEIATSLFNKKNMLKQFDIALRSIAKLLKQNPDYPDAKLACFTDDIRSFVLAKKDPSLVISVIQKCNTANQAIDMSQIGDISRKMPGRYADMLQQVGPTLKSARVPNGSKTNLSVHEMLTLYTVQSKLLNTGVLLATSPAMRAGLASKYFHGKPYDLEPYGAFPDGFVLNKLTKVSFADYMHDIQLVFDTVKHAKHRWGEPYKPLVVFRAVDLFDVGPADSVYAQDIPFDVVNNTICSTSTMLRHSAPFLKMKSPCCMLAVTVPNDFTRMIAVKPVSGYPDEEEIIFPPQSVFAVTKRSYMRYNNHNIVVLHATPSIQSVTGGGKRTASVGNLKLDISALNEHPIHVTSSMKNRLVGERLKTDKKR